MFSSLLVAASLLTTQPAGATKTTPADVLDIVRFNAALADDAVMHHAVELTGPVTEVYRDGIGGYVVRFDAGFQEPDALGRIEIHCHFAGAARGELAAIKRGQPVTLRGIPREIKDHLHWPTDASVRLTVKECVLVARAE